MAEEVIRKRDLIAVLGDTTVMEKAITYRSMIDRFAKRDGSLIAFRFGCVRNLVGYCVTERNVASEHACRYGAPVGVPYKCGTDRGAEDSAALRARGPNRAGRSAPVRGSGVPPLRW